MFNRTVRPRSLVNSLLMALVLAAGAWNSAVSAATTDQAGFRYDTSRLTTVDIALAGSDGSPALLSFYSQGPNGLRLLENGFTDAAGNYAADMQLPAHLTQVVVVVRTPEREDTLTLAITDQAITYTE
ncbi:hypothetical protein [uncultured Thiodictyon sp.]|jgi:hypothetical protein|uniref:hypothetical protein n=1 Tax=uncultured Thiodictyon sp. TaxID=1846217 RepID=UPI0025DB178E|nr:hypothetical protein [uncultured Thiodictyon sp.]